MKIYEISDLTRTYDKRIILDIPFLEIEDGKIYALKGANGAGKTSLLEILAFLETPTRGKLFYKKSPVNFSSKSSLLRLRKNVALVEQSPILFTGSVYRNVEFGLRVRKMEKQKRRRIVKRSLARVGMLKFARAPAHRLSGGETQRVALARAIAVLPKVFLCDEPTSSVDAESRTAIIDILRRVNEQEKTTVIFSTHDHDQSLGIAHHSLTLDCGKIAE